MTGPAISKIILVERMMRQKLSQKLRQKKGKNIKSLKRHQNKERTQRREENNTKDWLRPVPRLVKDEFYSFKVYVRIFGKNKDRHK